MKTIKQLLGENPRAPVTVAADDTVRAALEVMARHNIGAVLVMAGERLAGIFSERDYARKVALCDRSSSATPVRDIMTDKLICAQPGQTVDECMAIMTQKRIRHLPVMDNDRLVGLVSIGDLVKEMISEQAFTIEQLESYITR